MITNNPAWLVDILTGYVVCHSPDDVAAGVALRSFRFTGECQLGDFVHYEEKVIAASAYVSIFYWDGRPVERREQTVFLCDVPRGLRTELLVEAIRTGLEAQRKAIERRLDTRGDDVTPQTVFLRGRLQATIRKAHQSTYVQAGVETGGSETARANL